MASLRVELLPLNQALQNARAFNEQILLAAQEAISGQRIDQLKFSARHAMQCVLWVSGPSEAIAALKTYLDGQQIPYVAYEGTSPAHDDRTGGETQKPAAEE